MYRSAVFSILPLLPSAITPVLSNELKKPFIQSISWSYSDGVQALTALTQRSYASLITDCQMPNMNGYQLAAQIRANERASHTMHTLPILAITANTLRSEQERCFKVGMNDYPIKPIHLDTTHQFFRSSHISDFIIAKCSL